MEATAVSLIGIGVLALLGLQNALILALSNKSLARKNPPCHQINQSPQAFLGKIPVAYLAALLYGSILGQLFQVFQHGQIFWTGLAVSVLLLVLASGYYAYLLFFKLRLLCLICIRLHLINALMGIFVIGYHWYGEPHCKSLSSTWSL